jgi:GTPase Era involved in 16S rRNA processing
MNHQLSELQQRTLALIAEQQEFLQTLLNTPDLLKSSANTRTLDPNKANAWHSHLGTENQKVSHLEMVVGVVGTMKAGKSTTINALVGGEILPNRNQPMTTLPTLLRHRPHQNTPILHLPKRAPLLQLVQDLRNALLTVKTVAKLPLYQEKDGKALLEHLQKALLPIETHYHGQAAIFTFLRQLNDLVRLAQDLGINSDVYLQEYKQLYDFPMIELTFRHLDDKQSQGHFTLLDTPGPNESGQGQRLRRLLKDQLNQSSAIIAVLDYTQLKSEAEAEVRAMLQEEISEQLHDRLFILVNKFDQHDKNSMDYEETRHYVANSLMNKAIPPERVYPVAARYADLAGRALAALAQQPTLPDAPWVADFGELALGRRWQSKIHDTAEVRASAQTLYEDSHYAPLLQDLLQNTAAHAAQMTLQASVAKLERYQQESDNYLKLRFAGLTQDIAQVQQLLARLQTDIQEAQQVKVHTSIAVQKIVQEFSQLLTYAQDAMRLLLESEVESYFREGKRLEWDQQKLLFQQKQQNEALKNFVFSIFLPSLPIFSVAAAEQQDFNPQTRVLRFSSRSETENFARRLSATLHSIARENDKKLAHLLDNFSAKLQSDLQQLLDSQIQTIVKRAQSTLQGQGLTIHLHIPPVRFYHLNLDFDSILAQGQTHYQESRRRGGFFGWLGSFFGIDSWEYTYREVHSLDLDKIERQIQQSFHTMQQVGQKESEAYIKSQVQPVLENTFAQLHQYLSGFQQVLADGIADNQQQGIQREALKRTLEQLIQDSNSRLQRILTTKQHIQR